VSIEADCTEHDGDSFPTRSKIKFEFPERDGRSAFALYWYDGGQLPPIELFEGVTLAVDEGGTDIPPPFVSGALLIGDKAKMYAAGDYADRGIQIVGPVEELAVEFPRSTGHEQEWFNAIRNPNTPAMSNFPDYAGPLTETILLGNLALWKRGRVDWDAEKARPVNDPSLERMVRPSFPAGYEI
jgi:hypothetical protein